MISRKLVPSLRGKFGSNDYFIMKMKAEKLISMVNFPPKETADDKFTLQEIFQRDINYNRIVKEIVPYLTDNNRFFGSIIVATESWHDGQFETLPDSALKALPNHMQDDLSELGYISFKDGEQLSILDGQHRLKAIHFALHGKDHNGKDIETPKLSKESLKADDIAVVLIPLKKEDPSSVKRKRKIFTSTNKYAKKISKGESLVTDDDDVIAILSRNISDEVIGARLVKYKGQDYLGKKDRYFTTLSTLSDCNHQILKAHYPDRKISRSRLPAEEYVRDYDKMLKDIWTFLLRDVDVFSQMLVDRNESGDKKRRELREKFILCKPRVQQCFIHAFLRLTQPPSSELSLGLDREIAAKNLNKIDWRSDHGHWNGWPWRKEERKLRKPTLLITSRVIAYMAGANLSDEAADVLLKDFRKLEGAEKHKLPRRVV